MPNISISHSIILLIALAALLVLIKTFTLSSEFYKRQRERNELRKQVILNGILREEVKDEEKPHS